MTTDADMGTPLVIDDEVREQIKACIAVAEANPVDMTTLEARFKIPEEREKHRQMMTRQSVKIPFAYVATYSIEHGQPFGPARHFSMSVMRDGRVPNSIGLWMVAKEFGFWGSLSDCQGVWEEKLSDGGIAINIVQAVKPEQVKN